MGLVYYHRLQGVDVLSKWSETNISQSSNWGRKGWVLAHSFLSAQLLLPIISFPENSFYSSMLSYFLCLLMDS